MSETWTIEQRLSHQLRCDAETCDSLKQGPIADDLREAADALERPIPMLLWCPSCGERHVDVGEFSSKIHHTHACQSCGMVWRPAVVATVGVQWLPGFKNV